MGGLDRLDWNLVPALNALLQERNVSRAARRINVSQSAASGSLARLRRFFDDELLIRRGHAYDLTPLAERLVPLASAAVTSARSLIDTAASFDPATSTREFTLLMSDYTQAVLGAPLAASVAAAAPHVQLALMSPSAATSEEEELLPAIGDPAQLLAEVDGWVVPQDQVDAMPRTGHFEDRWVCVVAEDHPTIGETLTRDDLVAADWVSFTIPGLSRVPRLRPLLAHGIEPRIALVTESFSAIPFLVSGTTRIGLVQERLGRRLASAAGVRLLDPPVPLPPLLMTMNWHPDLAGDAGHQWLRTVVESACGRLGPDGPVDPSAG